MKQIFETQLVDEAIAQLKMSDLGNATIGQMSNLSTTLMERTGIPVVRMDQGVPSLEPSIVGRRA